MAYRTVIFDTQSGQRLADVEASGGTWQRGLIAQQSHQFNLRTLGLSRADAHDLFGKDRPRDRTLSVLYDDAPVYHGLIIDSDYDQSTGLLTVMHDDVRELAAARWLFGIGASTQTFDFTGLSWRGIARRIARIIYTDPISAAWPLPVALPAEEAGTKSLKTYGYEFRDGEDLLSEIEEMPGGPDLDFHPTLINDLYGWTFRIGDPYLSGPTREYHLQAPESPLSKVGVKTVGAEKITGVHGIGDGSEWDMVRGGAAASVAQGLARDATLTLKNDNLAKLNERSEAYLASRLSTYEQWRFNARTEDIGLTTLRLGSIIRIQSQGDPWIDDGWTEHRVLGFSGNLADDSEVTLTMETI